MEESEKELTVAESTESEEVDTQEPTEETTQNEETEAEFSDTPEEESEDDNSKETSEEDTKTEQSSEENSKFAQMRRKIEAEAKTKMEAEVQKAYEKGKIEAYKDKINPYTEKPITDLADIEIYEAMSKLEREGKDPLRDLPDELARKRREEAEAIQQKREMEVKTKKEVEDFQKKYPNEDLGELLKNSFFNDYIQGKNKPLVELYEGYNAFKNAFRNSAVDVAKQTIANAQASPGSLGSEAEVVVDYSTMSSEEFAKHVQMVKDGELK